LLNNSQPIDPKFYEQLDLPDSEELKGRTEPVISHQRIGKMFDDLFEDNRKISISQRLKWKIDNIKNKYYDIKHTIRNHFKWHKTMRELRPWDGYGGLLTVMQAHLRDYVNTEEKYGISQKEF